MPNYILTWLGSLFKTQKQGRTDYKIKLYVVDDHALCCKGLCNLLESLGYSILFTGFNGKDVIEKIDPNNLPDIVLTDMYMPGMDGFETAFWLKQNYPFVKVLGMGIEENENEVIKLIRNGADGFIMKAADPQEFRLAIQTIYKNDFYYPKEIFGHVVEYKAANLSNKLMLDTD